MPSSLGVLALSLLIFSSAANSQETEEALLEKMLPSVRASRADLNIRPSRWETRLTIPAVENILEDPLKAPETARLWSAQMRAASSSTELLRAGADALGIASKEQPPQSAGPRLLAAKRELPAAIVSALDLLLRAVKISHPLVAKASSSLSALEKKEILAAVRPSLTHEEGPRQDPAVFEKMARFDPASMIEAARTLTSAADLAIPLLREGTGLMREFKRERWTLPFGDVLLSGPGDDAYAPEDLAGVALLVDLGGRSRYSGPAAAAGDGEIRMVIDLAGEVTIDSPNAPSGGSGVFGIGLLYLPNPAGRKTLSAGDFSLGAGLFGVGGLFMQGSGSSFESRHFSQGAGAFGIGLFSAQGDAARYKALYAGQGFGFTRGAGLFIHKGHDAKVEGGLFYPDPREPLAAASLCQGVGFGPRAFAGGGIGLALADGDRNSFQSSYFAHGSGYWHGLGGLFLFGNENKLQARRYSQGAGVHTAVGLFTITGSSNHTVNWGVGPAYGWDLGVGYFNVNGDDNLFQADWATGHGDVNGHGLAVVRGGRNRLALPGFGSGALRRGAPSYGLAWIDGQDNQLRFDLPQSTRGAMSLAFNPWGSVAGDRLVLNASIEAPKPQWPDFDRTGALNREEDTLGKLFDQAQAAPEEGRLAHWLSLAASFTLTSEHPRGAARRLFSLPEKEFPALAALVAPEQFNEYLWQRLIFSAYGKSAASSLTAELTKSRGLRKALILGLMRHLPADQALPAAAGALKDPDWRVRREAAALLGYLFGKDTGEESGRLEFLRETAALSEKLAEQFPWKRLTDLFAALAFHPEFSPSEALALLDRTANPHDQVNAEIYREFSRLILARPQPLTAALKQELEQSARLAPGARLALLQLLADPDPDVVRTAVIALGQMGQEADAAKVARFLSHAASSVREAAAASLARMGPAARGELSRRVQDKEPRTRALAALAVAQSWDGEGLNLLGSALRDPEAQVRAAAISGLSIIPSRISALRVQFREDLKRIEEGDASLGLRAAAALALAGLPK